MKHKVYIAGCGRSGTTLLLKMMRCFSDVYTVRKEADLSMFDELENRTESTLIVKRKARAYEDLPELTRSVQLVYCVRNPLDVLTSSLVKPGKEKKRSTPKYYITMERWKAEFEALDELIKKQPERRIQYVHYEDVVMAPDHVQNEIAKFAGLEVNYRFSEHPDGVSIKASSINKYRDNEEMKVYLRNLPSAFWGRVERFGERFGYVIPAQREI